MTVTIAALVYGMVAWINGTGIITPSWPENTLEVNQTNLAGMAADLERCFVLGEEPVAMPTRSELYELADSMLGFYCHDRITIAGRVNLEEPEGQAVMVHELVHWLQDYNGDREAASCIPALERGAYAVQHQWQGEMGIPRYPDAFTVHMRSQCPPR